MTQVVNSLVKTIGVSQNPTENPTFLADAGDKYTEVHVRNNNDGVTLTFAFDAVALMPVTMDVFVVPGGGTAIFLLAPNQKLYVVASAAGATVSYLRSLARYYTAGCLDG